MTDFAQWYNFFHTLFYILYNRLLNKSIVLFKRRIIFYKIV